MTLLFGTDQWQRLVPASWQIIPDAWAVFVHDATFHMPDEADPFCHYNALQQLSYFAVVFVLAPLSVMTGLAMSPAIDSRFPWYPKVFGGRQSARSIPRNTLCGHAIGILCGYASLWLMGLTHDPPTMVEGVEMNRVFCAALSLASAGALMVLLDMWHPPAGATTLIIALGIITRPYHLLIVEAAVFILVLQALVINRLAGIEYPVWGRAAPVVQHEPVATEGPPQDENLRRTKH